MSNDHNEFDYLALRNYLKSRLRRAESMSTSIPQQGAGEWNESERIEPVLVIADEECAALRQPPRVRSTTRRRGFDFLCLRALASSRRQRPASEGFARLQYRTESVTRLLDPARCRR